MKAKYIGKSSSCVTNGKVYDVEVYAGYYHLTDDEGDNNSYHRDEFELVEDAKPAPLIDGPGLYRTRNGDTVEIIGLRPASDFTHEGSCREHTWSGVIVKDGSTECYRPNGSWGVQADASGPYDIVEKIDEPAKQEEHRAYEQPSANPEALLRQFSSGATRNLDNNKYDYEGFLSPLVIEAFGKYMHSHRLQKDGTMRDSANWQRGIPLDVYMKSGWRHFFDWWKLHRGVDATSPEDGHKIDKVEALCALLFNVQGYMHELLKEQSNE